MALKGYAEAHNYKGGFEKWVYDTLVTLEAAGYDDTALKARVAALEATVEALENAETPAETPEP